MSTQGCLIYEPLPNASEYLRILTILAGNVSDPIRCTMRTVSFRDNPSYDTLSYAWGDPNATKSIQVDGVVLQVTSNLKQALRHMRDKETDLVLWVDAVCINQLDLNEKSHQVAIMGQIYRKCAQVRIWLGCHAAQCSLEPSSSSTGNAADDSSEGVDAFRIIRDLAEDRHIREWPCFHTQTDHSPSAAVYEANHDFNMICEGFLAIDRSPWWTRMWTVQEAILPKTGFLVYDTWTTSLQTITDCGQNYYNHAWKSCCQEAVAKLPSTVRNALEEFCSVAVTLHGDRIRNEFGEVQQYDLPAQHSAYGFRACEDPRDKVYGLLGIIDKPLFTPNYTLSEDEVFFQATYWMLCREGGTLRSLAGPYYGPAPGKWASWVRNFDAPFDCLDADVACDRCALNDSTIFESFDSHISYFMLHMAQPRPVGGRPNQVGLEVVGKRVGIVTFVSQNVQVQLSHNEVGERRHVFRQWMLEALNWDVNENLAYTDTPGVSDRDPDIVMKFWRTMLGGIGKIRSAEVYNWEKFTPEAMSWLEPFLAWLREEKSTMRMTLSRVISLATHRRCYFKAENNNHGLCHPGACVGDEVWVLEGGRVPFILRPTSLDQEEKQALRPLDAYGFGNSEQEDFWSHRQFEKPLEGYYQFIGDCYFDGYMHGEAYQNESLPKHSIMVV